MGIKPSLPQQELFVSALDKLSSRRIEYLELENDILKAFIINMWNANPAERFNMLWDAHDYIKQLNKPK